MVSVPWVYYVSILRYFERRKIIGRSAECGRVSVVWSLVLGTIDSVIYLCDLEEQIIYCLKNQQILRDILAVIQEQVRKSIQTRKMF